MSRIRKSNVAFFAGLCLLFSLWELSIPKPVSFVRLGLGNCALMLALFTGFSFKEFAVLVLLKVAGSAILGGTFFSYVLLLSLSSSLASSLALYALYRTRLFSFVGLAVLSAAVGNIAQLSVAIAILGRPAIALAPIILGFGLFTSIVLGAFTQHYVSSSRILDRLQDCKLPKPSEKGSYWPLCWIGMSLCLLILDDVRLQAALMAIALIATIIKGLRLNLGMNLVSFSAIVILSLLSPSGLVLLDLGWLSITQGALIIGLKRAITLIGTLYYSRLASGALMKLSSRSELLGSSLAVFSLFSSRPVGLKRKAKLGPGLSEFLDQSIASVLDCQHD